MFAFALSALRKPLHCYTTYHRYINKTAGLMANALKRINPDIEKERLSATFDVEDFAKWWSGGVEKLNLKRQIANEMASDPELEEDIPFDYLSYQDQYNNAIKRGTILATKLMKLQEKLNPGGNDIFPVLMTNPTYAGFIPVGSPLAIHYMMFLPAIEKQGTPEQVSKWMPLALAGKALGTFTQTEMGHGTYIRGIETRADYDLKTEEFVINTPSITAYKWWPGGLGHSVNHAIVVAQLFIKEKNYGVQLFIVRVRDDETHMPMPGIHVGDIGNKLGLKGVNNGFLGLKNVRVPRMNMLMKNAQVNADGTFESLTHPLLAYWTMIVTRVQVVNDAALLLSQAATITTRYSAVRRQSVINPKEAEHQIIDHVTQQLKVFPEIAKSIAIKIGSEYLDAMYKEVTQELNEGKLDRLGEIHALASCLKAIATTDASTGIENLRLACGGHGYMLASNLSNIYNFSTAACTYEGENTVMLLQTVRFLMKAWATALKGGELDQTVAYLADAAKAVRFPQWDGSLQCMVKALQFSAANKVRVAFNHLAEKQKQGNTPAEAANATAIELSQAADLHGRAFLAETIYKKIAMEESIQPAKFRTVLLDLLELYLANACLKQMGDILRCIPLTEEDLSSLQSTMEQALTRLRPNAVAIVDGFDYHDRQLNSVLGSYDGNAYERIFEAAQKNPMNEVPVQKSFHEYLKPFMNSNM